MSTLNERDCTGCGYCCKQVPCLYAWALNYTESPCLLLVHKDGRYWCSLVLKATGEDKAKLARGLMIGEGCIGPQMKAVIEREKKDDG